MTPRLPKSPTRTGAPVGKCPAVRHRGRVGRAALPGRCAREHAWASAVAEMHQPTPSTHRNRRRMDFANQVAGGKVG
eukprot:6802643-Pyramimonas_sp.AAC.1